MASSAPSHCPSCGAAARGRFCGACGAALGGSTCPACGVATPRAAPFCGNCGVQLAGSPAGGSAPRSVGLPRRFWPVALAAVAGILALVALLIPRNAPPAADRSAGPFAAAGVAPLPDLANVAPRDRFDTLYNRVMRASEQGDDATIGRLAPMALAAYAELGEPDADARYHAAMIRLHTGDPGGAAALADTISLILPSHLFGFVIRGTVARLQGDAGRLVAEQAEFRRHYDLEMAAGRDEYGHHRFILDQFVRETGGR